MKCETVSLLNMGNSSYIAVLFINKYRVFFSPCLTKNCWLKSPPDAPPKSRRTPKVGKVYQSMKEARQTIALIITFIKSNKSSLERWTCQVRKKKPCNCSF
jgi:hypothetical protein